MAIFLDSANIEEAQAAAELSWVCGVTTNPLLLANSGREPREVLHELAHLRFEKVFYQIRAKTDDDLRAELKQAKDILKNKLVVKLPPTSFGLQVAADLAEHYQTCITAVYSVAQALAAREAGATSVAIYVHRATELMGDGLGLLSSIAKVLAGSTTEILAASLRTPMEAEFAAIAGAQHLTVSWSVMQNFLADDLSLAAIEEFDLNGKGLLSS